MAKKSGAIHLAGWSPLRLQLRTLWRSLENRESSDVVIVLGMHRSGTSAVAGTLVKLGGGPPKHLMVANPGNARGYFESVAFMHFHDELLASAGSRWHDWRLFNPGWYRSPVAAEYRRRAKELFEAEFRGAALPVIKDPRICRFAPFWLGVLREMQKTPRIVIPIRSPLEVAQSLEKQQGVPLKEGLLLWLRHNLDAEVQSRAAARSIFTFDEFQSDWRGVCDRISTDTNLFWPRLSDRTSREIDSFLTKDLVHHETDRAALAAHSALHEWTLRAYDALLELARDPSSDSALDTLDEVRALLEQSSKMFGRILVDYEIALEDVRGKFHALTSERDLLRVRQSAIRTESAAATAEFAAVVRDKDALSQSLAASVAERDALREERARMAAELQSRQQELAEQAEALRDKDALSQSLAVSVAERDVLREGCAWMAAELQSRQQELTEQAEALRDKDALSQNLAASVAERDALREGCARMAAEWQSRQQELEEKAAEAARDKDALSQSLAASVAERDALREGRARMAAELQSRQQELEEKAAALAEFAARDELAEIALGEAESALEAAVRDQEALSQRLTASLAERDALSEERASIAAQLQSRRKELAEKAAALADLEERHRSVLAELAASQQSSAAVAQKHADALAALELERSKKAAIEAARADLAGTLDRTMAEKRGLAAHLDHALSELQRVERIWSERASAQDAAHSFALATERSAHEAQVHALGGQLVDAEAALSHAAAKHARADLSARVLPASWRRRMLARRFGRSGLLDPSWYRATYPDAAGSGFAAAEHYLEIGFCRGYRPNPFFDTRGYLERYEDVRRSGVNPLLHYLEQGWREGRDPGPDFHTDYYLDANPDVRANGMNPLVHYLRHGRHEGRLPRRPARE